MIMINGRQEDHDCNHDHGRHREAFFESISACGASDGFL